MLALCVYMVDCTGELGGLWEVAGPGFRLIKYVVSDLSTPLPSTACSAASEPSVSSQHDSQL